MTIVPVRREIVVAAPQDRAFDVFARRMGSWWNPLHHILDEELADVLIEPRVGGRWAEVGRSGAEYAWGQVLVWEPPSRVVLAWQLDTQWEYAADLETEVEVRFVRGRRRPHPRRARAPPPRAVRRGRRRRCAAPSTPRTGGTACSAGTRMWSGEVGLGAWSPSPPPTGSTARRCSTSPATGTTSP